MPVQEISVKSAIIGGSTGFRFLKKHRDELQSLGAIETPFGDSAPVHLCSAKGTEFLYLSRHGENGYDLTASFVNYRANIWALKSLGVERIISWSGPAAIDPAIKIGEVLVPGDLIDETKRREYTYFEGTGLGFIRQSPVFCPELSGALIDSIEKRFGVCRKDDVYVCTEGPRLETPAEIRKYASYGGSLVGMTLVPEVFLAKELEICYAAVCYVTNFAEGVRERAFRPGVLFEGLLDDAEARSVDDAVAAIAETAVSVLAKLDTEPRSCSCPKFMERYRRRGSIGGDWRSWILPK
ncbi:MAG: MTAP family purine nucleoside phosphorylase [Armatimonadota bacterium]